MRIGFDAKRALNNYTGLGNHARILLNAMMRDYPANDYLVFTPKVEQYLFPELQGRFELCLPEGMMRGGIWRSWGLTGDLVKRQVQLFHGLSNELPFNIHRSGIKTVVTIHDLIFLKHTEQYPFTDRQIYALKTRYAVKHAHKIIAVSQETKKDLMHFYQVPEEKMEVIYPSVDINFQTSVSYDVSLSEAYELPAKFILNVGSFFPRKNQKTLIEAFALIKDKIEEDLVLVGAYGSVMEEVEALIAEKKLGSRVKIVTTVSNADMPGVYRLASLFVFPSLFEGFGAPVLEALFSGVPVIASKGGAIEEAAGEGAIIVDPRSVEEMADAMLKVLSSKTVQQQMREAGYKHAQTMTDKVFAEKTMQVYQQVIRT